MLQFFIMKNKAVKKIKIKFFGNGKTVVHDVNLNALSKADKMAFVGSNVFVALKHEYIGCQIPDCVGDDVYGLFDWNDLGAENAWVKQTILCRTLIKNEQAIEKKSNIVKDTCKKPLGYYERKRAKINKVFVRGLGFDYTKIHNAVREFPH